MKNMKSLALVAVLLLMRPALADESKVRAPQVITSLQVSQAISLLIEVGVLNVEDSGLVVKRPSVLQELYEQGHVEHGHAEVNAICLK